MTEIQQYIEEWMEYMEGIPLGEEELRTVARELIRGGCSPKTLVNEARVGYILGDNMKFVYETLIAKIHSKLNGVRLSSEISESCQKQNKDEVVLAIVSMIILELDEWIRERGSP